MGEQDKQSVLENQVRRPADKTGDHISSKKFRGDIQWHSTALSLSPGVAPATLLLVNSAHGPTPSPPWFQHLPEWHRVRCQHGVCLPSASAAVPTGEAGTVSSYRGSCHLVSPASPGKTSSVLFSPAALRELPIASAALTPHTPGLYRASASHHASAKGAGNVAEGQPDRSLLPAQPRCAPKAAAKLSAPSRCGRSGPLVRRHRHARGSPAGSAPPHAPPGAQSPAPVPSHGGAGAGRAAGGSAPPWQHPAPGGGGVDRGHRPTGLGAGAIGEVRGGRRRALRPAPEARGSLLSPQGPAAAEGGAKAADAAGAGREARSPRAHPDLAGDGADAVSGGAGPGWGWAVSCPGDRAGARARRFLRQELPEEWPLERLAQGFGVSPDVVRRVLRSRHCPPPHRQQRQDQRALNAAPGPRLAPTPGEGCEVRAPDGTLLYRLPYRLPRGRGGPGPGAQ